MLKILSISIFLLGIVTLKAQQLPQYSLYMLDGYHTNVAYAGMDNYLSATGVFRKQWLGLEGSPMTQHINVHLPWYYLSGGAGLSIENDIQGAERNTAISLSYNYIARLSESLRLSFGLGGGIMQKALDGSKLFAPEGNYEGVTINHNDDLIPIGIESSFAPTATAGIYLQTISLEIGFAANHLTESLIRYESGIATEIQLKRHYLATAIYRFNISDEWNVQPSILLKSDFVETQADFSILAQLNNNIFAGASFRGYNGNTIDALIFLAGMNISPKIRLAYAYDLSLSRLSNYQTGSHEILLNYNLNKEIGGKIPAKTIYNPRYF